MNTKYHQNNKEEESVAHFVTVIGCLADEWGENKKRYEEAIQYTLDFIKYRFNSKNIK
jgi:hypothetical protein